MRTITSKKYLKPEYQGSLVKITPKAGGGEPEYMEQVKFVDRETNKVYYYVNGTCVDSNTYETVNS